MSRDPKVGPLFTVPPGPKVTFLNVFAIFQASMTKKKFGGRYPSPRGDIPVFFKKNFSSVNRKQNSVERRRDETTVTAYLLIF